MELLKEMSKEVCDHCGASCGNYPVNDLLLLAQVTRINPHDPDKIHDILSQKTNWPCFFNLAQSCGIPSLLYRQIKSNNWDSAVPGPVMEHLKEEYVRVRGINTAYYHELFKIIALFQQEGIRSTRLV